MADEPATHAPAPGRPRGPMVDLDPSGQVTSREPDRTVRQFLNYAFFKLDPAFRRLSLDERGAAAQEAAGFLGRLPKPKAARFFVACLTSGGRFEWVRIMGR